MDGGELLLTNSTFSEGKRSNIYATQSHIILRRVTVFDSKDEHANGLGLTCISCLSIEISDSEFRNLTALNAPAIYIVDQMQATTRIMRTRFESNHALESGGAIKV